MAEKFTVDFDEARLAQISRAATVALEKTIEAIHTEVVQAQVVPRDTGALQNEKTHADLKESAKGRVRLITEGPYARRLYYHPEYNFRKDKNPNAKGKWLEDWLPGGKKSDFAQQAFSKFFKREAGL